MPHGGHLPGGLPDDGGILQVGGGAEGVALQPQAVFFGHLPAVRGDGGDIDLTVSVHMASFPRRSSGEKTAFSAFIFYHITLSAVPPLVFTGFFSTMELTQKTQGGRSHDPF